MWHEITDNLFPSEKRFFGLGIHSYVFIFHVPLLSLIFLPLFLFHSPRPSLCHTASSSPSALISLLSQRQTSSLEELPGFPSYSSFKTLCQELLELTWLACGDPAQSAPEVTVQQSCLERTSVLSGVEWPGHAGEAMGSKTEQRVWVSVFRVTPEAWNLVLVHKKRQKRSFWLTEVQSVVQWFRQHQMEQMCLGAVFHPDQKTREHFEWDRIVENIAIYFGKKENASWGAEMYR